MYSSVQEIGTSAKSCTSHSGWTIFYRFQLIFYQFKINSIYLIVVSSKLEAHSGIFRLKGVFEVYLLGPFDKKLIFVLIKCIRTSVRPKPGFGIGNRNQDQVSVSVSGPELFLPRPKLSPI